jgi:hypothetical protein
MMPNLQDIENQEYSMALFGGMCQNESVRCVIMKQFFG